jgi:hypothetical protein
MNEKIAQQQNQALTAQLTMDNRIPSSLQNKAAAHDAYNQNAFQGQGLQERPTRGPSSNLNSNNLTGKPDSNFGSRKQINIDENEDTVASQGGFEAILQRGARLQQ